MSEGEVLKFRHGRHRTDPIEIVPRKDDAPIYERLKGETQKAFNAYATYRDLGLSRTIPQVLEKLNLGKSDTLIRRWKKRYSWDLRNVEFDAEEDRRVALILQEKRVSARIEDAEVAETMMETIKSRMLEIKPGELTPTTAAQWYETAVKMRRLALGESTQNIEQHTKITGKVEHTNELTKAILNDPSLAASAARLLNAASDSRD